MPLYSEEIQDIMGRIPGRILRIGLTVIFGIVLLLIVGSYFFKYPEIVSCPVVLTTINPPLELYAQSTGKIERLYFEEHEKVQAGELIAILNNTANYQDVLMLKREFDKLSVVADWDSIVRNSELSGPLSLGELQNDYLRFYKGWTVYRHYLQQQYLPIKIILLQRQIIQQTNIYNDLCRQQALLQRDFQLTEKQYHRDSVFFYKYNEAVSAVEYEKQTQNYLQKKSSYINFCTSIQQAKNNILKLEETKIDLGIQYEKECKSFRTELEEAYQLLLESYRQWCKKYLVVSTIAGKVTFTGHWCENQLVNSGERIATVVPEQTMQIIGRALIDMAGIGKVAPGQSVQIKLNGYPHMEYGILKGVIRHISLVPEKGKGYVAEITLIRGMESSYREQLQFIHEMEGVADIVTENQRFLLRLIQSLKAKINE